MKTLKIDFAILSIISLIATYVDQWTGLFHIEIETWKILDIILIIFFIVFMILEIIQIIVDKRNGNKE